MTKIATSPPMSPSSLNAETYRGVRISKLRHVYGRGERKEKCYEGLRVSTSDSGCQLVAVNPKFIAVAIDVAGGGAFQCVPLKWTGKIDYHMGRVSGAHSAPIACVAWNPFNDNVLATGSDDSTVKLWYVTILTTKEIFRYIPDGGIRTRCLNSLLTLRQHTRRVTHLLWHPTADNILASTSLDQTIILWNTSTCTPIGQNECHTDVVHDVSFNGVGSRIATTSRDGRLRIVDARSGDLIGKVECHSGGKTTRCIYLGNTGCILTTGVWGASRRQIRLWNEVHMDQGPLTTIDIDGNGGVLCPYFDADLNMIYIGGRGDGNVRLYELTPTTQPYLHFLSEYASKTPQRSLSLMPKRAVSVAQCELARLYKVHAGSALIEPISFIIPRRTDVFQHDVYPPTAGPSAALTAQEWMAGIDAPPVTISLQTTNQSRVTHKAVHVKTTPSNDCHPTLVTSDKNTDKKFAFLSQAVKPDYRTLEQRDDRDAICKERQIRETLIESNSCGESNASTTDGETAFKMCRRMSHNDVDEQIAAVLNRSSAVTSPQWPIRSPPPLNGHTSAPPDFGADVEAIKRFSTGSDISDGDFRENTPISNSSRHKTPPIAMQEESDDLLSDGEENILESPTPVASTKRSPVSTTSATATTVTTTTTADTTTTTTTNNNTTSSTEAMLLASESCTLDYSDEEDDTRPPSDDALLQSLATSSTSTWQTTAVPSRSHVTPVNIDNGNKTHLFVKPSGSKTSTSTRPGRIGPTHVPKAGASRKTSSADDSKGTSPTTSAQPSLVLANDHALTESLSVEEIKNGGENYTQQCKLVRELMTSADEKDSTIAQLQGDLAESTAKANRALSDAQRYHDDIESYRYEINWKNDRIAYLEEELARLDPSSTTAPMRVVAKVYDHHEEDDSSDDEGRTCSTPHKLAAKLNNN